MSSISNVSRPPVQPSLLSGASAPGRASDGDTAAQEAAESSATKIAETQNGGFAPSKNIVNKTA